MAVRNALVIIAGVVQEMPGGDTLAGAGGGGGSIAQATLSVGPAVYGQAEVSVSVGGVTSTSKVLAQLVPNDEWDADDLAEISVVPTPGAGVIVFSILRDGPIAGDFSVNYQVNA